MDDDKFWEKVYAVARKAGRAYLATVDEGRPRVRVVFPGFEGRKLWIATKRNSAKARHIERDPNVELFWEVGSARPIAHLTLTGAARFVDSAAEKKRIWDGEFFGYGLAEFWPGGSQSSDFGLVLVVPNRIELGWQPAMWQGQRPEIWTA